jgi:transcriptional regulator with XRE-family HTH domain
MSDKKPRQSNVTRFSSPITQEIYELGRASPKTFREIEDEAGVSRHAFQYLRQARSPTLATLEPLCEVLGVRLTVVKR